MKRYLYIIKAETDLGLFYKVGFSKHPAQRLQQIKRKHPLKTTVKLMSVVKAICVTNAVLSEKVVHNYLKDQHCERVEGSTEWFRVPENELALLLECETEVDVLTVCFAI